jgi:hypothetical protein
LPLVHSKNHTWNPTIKILKLNDTKKKASWQRIILQVKQQGTTERWEWMTTYIWFWWLCIPTWNR